MKITIVRDNEETIEMDVDSIKIECRDNSGAPVEYGVQEASDGDLHVFGLEGETWWTNGFMVGHSGIRIKVGYIND